MILVLCAIILATAVIEALIFLRMFRLPFIQITLLGATNSLTHWIGWIGTLYIAFFTPIQPLIKRKKPKHFQTARGIHMIGNLLAVLLVSVHFAHQVTRPADNYPDLGTGIVLYATMILLVTTGMVIYSGITKKYYRQMQFLHPAFALTFYTVIIMHIIHGI